MNAALAQSAERLTRKEEPLGFGPSSVGARNPYKYWEVEGRRQAPVLPTGIPFRIYSVKVSR